MKSTIKNVLRPIKYPKAYKNKHCDLVVIFIGDGVGTVIHTEEGHATLGTYSEDWISHDNKSEWEEFKGVIELDFGV